MTAQILPFRQPQDSFALARHVVRDGRYSAETIAAALDVLEASTDANDQATVAWMRNYAPRLADMHQITEADRAVSQMQFILLAVAAVGLGIGVALADWAMTAAIAASLATGGV